MFDEKVKLKLSPEKLVEPKGDDTIYGEYYKHFQIKSNLILSIFEFSYNTHLSSLEININLT